MHKISNEKKFKPHNSALLMFVAVVTAAFTLGQVTLFNTKYSVPNPVDFWPVYPRIPIIPVEKINDYPTWCPV